MYKAHNSALTSWAGLMFAIALCTFILHFCVFNGMNTVHQQTIDQVEQFVENSPLDSDLHEDDLVDARAVSPKISLAHPANEWVTFLNPQSTDSEQLTPPPESI